MTIASDEICFSFTYSSGTGRYSFEIMAESQDDALAAVKGAIFEGAIYPTSVCEAHQFESPEVSA